MKLYVGNLSFNTSDQELTSLFSEIGTVQSANIIQDRETGRSRGFAFVEMATKEAGEKAIATLHGKEIDGRALKVNEAKPQENRSFGGGGRSYGGDRDYSSDRNFDDDRRGFVGAGQAGKPGF